MGTGLVVAAERPITTSPELDPDVRRRLFDRYTIDPLALTCFTRTHTQLEAFLLLCVCAAWGPLQTQAERLAWLLRPSIGAPISWLRTHSLDYAVQLRKLRTSRLCPSAEMLHDAIAQASVIKDLATVPLERLYARIWLRPCYANMFVLHSRKSQHLAVIDTTAMRWLRAHGVAVPKASAHRITAASSARLQEEWLKLYPATFVGMTAAQAHTALLRETEKETT